jgi:tripartite-type tricarboxylate transporter receptor subunit TctC
MWKLIFFKPIKFFPIFLMNKKLRLLVALSSWLLSLTLPNPSTAQIQAYPTHPLKLIVPAAAAGPTDFLGRIAAEYLAQALGQPVIVENVPTAGGNLGLQNLARAPADGYTLIIASQSMMVIGAFLHPNLPFNHEHDFAPVMIMAAPPYVLVLNQSVPANNLTELIDYLKKNPGKLSYASTGGVGSSSHVAAELFKSVAGVDIVHVPYKGNAQATTDLLGGQVQMMFSLASSMQQPVQTGKLKAIAVGSAQRSQALPTIASFNEAGLAGFTATSWFGIFARAGTPAPILQRLNTALNKMLADPQTQAKLLAAGADPAGGTVHDAQKFIAAERMKWGGVIKEAGITLN